MQQEQLDEIERGRPRLRKLSMQKLRRNQQIIRSQIAGLTDPIAAAKVAHSWPKAPDGTLRVYGRHTKEEVLENLQAWDKEIYLEILRRVGG